MPLILILRRQRQADLSLLYRVSSETTRVTQKTLSREIKKKKKRKNFFKCQPRGPSSNCVTLNDSRLFFCVLEERSTSTGLTGKVREIIYKEHLCDLIYSKCSVNNSS